MVVVFAAAQPDPHPRMLDRFLVIAEGNELSARIVVNKAELVGGPKAVEQRFALYVAAGYPLSADFNGARQNGFGYYTFTQKGGERLTAEAAYLASIAERVVLHGHVPTSLLSVETVAQMEADEAAASSGR